MSRAELLQQLRGLLPWLTTQGVSHVRLFGSFARDEAREDSDIDLLVDFSVVPGLEFFALERTLSERLRRPVEISTEAALHPIIRDRVLAEAVRV